MKQDAPTHNETTFEDFHACIAKAQEYSDYHRRPRAVFSTNGNYGPWYFMVYMPHLQVPSAVKYVCFPGNRNSRALIDILK